MTSIPAVLLMVVFLSTLSFPSSVHADDPAGTSPVTGQMSSSPHGRIDPHAAIEQFRKEMASHPYDAIPKQNLAGALLSYGVVLLKQNRYDEATARFAEAEELLPDDPVPAFYHGNALYLLKQYDFARVELEKARSLGGDTADILLLLGKIAYDTDDIAQAVELWEQALQIAPDNRVIAELLAKARRELQLDAKMEKGHSSRFILSFDTGVRPDVADHILDALEEAYNRVGRDLNDYPEALVPVILYTGRDYREITGSPDWSGGQYDGKIRLPVGGLSSLTPQLRGVLFHEYTHVVINELTRGNCPVWLNEGLAEIEGRKEYDPPLLMLTRAVSEKRLLPLKAIKGSFTALSAKDVPLAYEQSYSLVNYMVTTYGWHLVNALLTALGQGKSFDAAMTQAYADVGRTFADIFAEWQDQVQQEAAR